MNSTDLVADEVAVFVTVDFLIALKDTVAGSSAHEVVITLTGGETAAHRRPGLTASLTALKRNKRMNQVQMMMQMRVCFNHLAPSEKLTCSYQETSSGYSAVHVHQRASDFLHLSRPDTAVHMSPLILAQVQQPSCFL